MSQSREVAVLGTGLFTPGFVGVKAWMTNAYDEEAVKASGSSIKPRKRRRTSQLTRALADAYHEAMEGTQLNQSEVCSVFGSALGEVSVMLSILEQVWGNKTSVSPMKFVGSVHNAASGTVSISNENRHFTTSTGSDYDTPAMALIEGMGLVLSQGKASVIACGDEASPDSLIDPVKGWDFLVGAIAIAPIDEAPNACRLSIPTIQAPTLDAAKAPAGIAQNPNAGILDLIHAIHHQHEGVVRLDRGRGQGFSVAVKHALA